MKLWDTYFRMWGKFSDFLTKDQKKRALLGRLSEMTESTQEDERATDYYGYLCNKDVCAKSGI